MKAIEFNLKIIQIMIKGAVSDPKKLFADTSMLVARCGVLLCLYYYIFNWKGGAINNVSFQVASWSMFLYFVLMTLKLRSVAHNIAADVKSGNIEMLLTKPINYIMYRMGIQFGSGIFAMSISIFVGSLLLIYFVGIPDSMLSSFFIFTFLITLSFGCILTLIIFSIVGLFSFWIEDINPIYWMIDKSIMILGGSYLPVALFPKLMYDIAIWSPFGASQFISHTVYESWSYEYIEFMGRQLFWIIIFGFILYNVSVLAYKKVSVNGG